MLIKKISFVVLKDGYMNDYRILVVDDEEDLCEILKFNLENEGYLWTRQTPPKKP